MAGKVRKRSEQASDKLAELGHDPIEQHVKLFQEAMSVYNADKTKTALDRAIDVNKTLLEYGYSKAPRIAEGSVDHTGAVGLTFIHGDGQLPAPPDEKVIEGTAQEVLPAPQVAENWLDD